MINLRKTLIAAAAIAAIGATLAASTTEASAHGWGWGGGWGHHWGWGFGGAAAATGLAIAATAPAYAGDGCYIASRRVYDGYGNFVGYSHFQVCN